MRVTDNPLQKIWEQRRAQLVIHVIEISRFLVVITLFDCGHRLEPLFVVFLNTEKNIFKKNESFWSYQDFLSKYAICQSNRTAQRVRNNLGTPLLRNWWFLTISNWTQLYRKRFPQVCDSELPAFSDCRLEKISKQREGCAFWVEKNEWGLLFVEINAPCVIHAIQSIWWPQLIRQQTEGWSFFLVLIGTFRPTRKFRRQIIDFRDDFWGSRNNERK